MPDFEPVELGLDENVGAVPYRLLASPELPLTRGVDVTADLALTDVEMVCDLFLVEPEEV